MIPREVKLPPQTRRLPGRNLPGHLPYPVCADKITPQMHKDALPQRIKPIPPYIRLKRPRLLLPSLAPYASVSRSTSFYRGGNLPLPDKASEKFYGFHMMTIVGWKKVIDGSPSTPQGANWGALKGYCTIPFNYPINEMWAVTDMTVHSKPDYEVNLTRRGRYWRVSFNTYFRSSTEAMDKLSSRWKKTSASQAAP